MGYTTQLFKVPFRAFAVSEPSRPEAGGRWVGTKQTQSTRIHKIMNEIESTHRECSRPWELFTIDLGHCININKNNRTQKFHSGLSVTKAKIRYTFVPALSEEEGVILTPQNLSCFEINTRYIEKKIFR